MGVTKLPPPASIALTAETEDNGEPDVNQQVPEPCELTVDSDGVIVLSIPEPPPGVAPGSAEDTDFHACMDWLFLEWSMKTWDDNPKSSMGAVKSDNEDGFERWIRCAFRSILPCDWDATTVEVLVLVGN